jgi:hypothetical protein
MMTFKNKFSGCFMIIAEKSLNIDCSRIDRIMIEVTNLLEIKPLFNKNASLNRL